MDVFLSINQKMKNMKRRSAGARSTLKRREGDF